MHGASSPPLRQGLGRLSFRRSSFALALFLLAFVGRLTGAYAQPPVAFDPLSNAPICAHAGDLGGPDGDQPLATHAKCLSDCCKIFVSTTPLVAPAPAVRIEARVEWRRPPAPIFVDRHAFVLRARGPPRFS